MRRRATSIIAEAAWLVADRVFSSRRDINLALSQLELSSMPMFMLHSRLHSILSLQQNYQKIYKDENTPGAAFTELQTLSHNHN